MNILRRILILVVLIALKINLFGQDGSYTLYFMDRVPQSTLLNPAFQPKCNAFIGMPLASSYFMDIGNSTLSLNDILVKNPGMTVLSTPFSPNADSSTRAKFLNSLKDNNSFYSNFQEEILTFGFRISDLYFTFGATLKSNSGFNYPGDLFKLAINGIDTATNYNLGNLGANSTTYVELALGLSKKFNDAFSIGVRGKLLNGIADVSSGNNKFTIKSNVDPLNKLFKLDISSDMTINSYVPVVSGLDSIFDGKKIKTLSNPLKHLPILKSIGFAADFGFSYFGINHLVLSASLIDFGYINWKQDVNNISLKGNFSFEGVQYDFVNNKDNSKILQNIEDTLKKAVKVTTTKAQYKTWLPTKLYIGMEFLPEEYFSLGLLSATQIYKQQLTQQLTLSANLKPFKMWHLSASYSVLNNGFSNVGFGMALKFTALQFYFVSDNIPVRFGHYGGVPIVPYKLQSFSYRVGSNWVFGCNTKKKKEADKPLIFEDVLLDK